MKGVARVGALLSLLISSGALAQWDGVNSGRISGIDVTEGQNYGFRVYLDGTPMCGTSEAWAYMNADWNNYEAAAALLTSAYLSGRSVIVYTTRNGSACEIGYVSFR